jgi:hypothetical protein
VVLLSLVLVPGIGLAQKEQEASIPLDHFYVDRQGSGLLRKLLSKLTIGLSTGYAATPFTHTLPDVAVFQPPSGQPLVINPASPTVGYTNWFNRFNAVPVAINPGDFVVSGDTTDLGFKSNSFAIPLKATVHVEFLKRYRIGGGYSMEFTKVNPFEPRVYAKQINNFSPDFSTFFLKKYFVLLGGSVYRYEDYLLTVDANIGGFSLGKNFDKSLIKKGVYLNLGTTVERDMSEYFRLFIRPSYDFKGYSIHFPEGGGSIKHRLNAFHFSVGASYRIPELRRCYLKECKAQVNHAHGNREYRSRVHPVHKKQNPQTGENYPSLIKYKGKNKRKLNPY